MPWNHIVNIKFSFAFAHDLFMHWIGSIHSRMWVLWLFSLNEIVSCCLMAGTCIAPCYPKSGNTIHYVSVYWSSSCSPADGKVWCSARYHCRASFYLWEQAPSSESTCLISAIDAYKSSTKHTAVTQAVDEIFKADKGRLFKEAVESKNTSKSAFAKQLMRIALDNRLPPP